MVMLAYYRSISSICIRQGWRTRGFSCQLRQVLLLACSLNYATAQIAPIGSEVISKCDLRDLNGRITKLNDACCVECDQKCDVRCVAVIFPLLDDCGGLINKLYDGTDGKEDGQASVFANVYSDCLKIPTEKVLSDLKYLHSQGQCPDVLLDGVAATEVGTAPCTDTWITSARGCDAAIASGILTCEKNFCSTPPTIHAPCELAGHCDKTCGFCTTDLGGEQEGDRRRTQEFVGDFIHTGASCMSSFEAEAARINDACCDTGMDSNVCASGVPTECDAKCAVVFNDFYGRCDRFAKLLLAHNT